MLGCSLLSKKRHPSSIILIKALRNNRIYVFSRRKESVVFQVEIHFVKSLSKLIRSVFFVEQRSQKVLQHHYFQAVNYCGSIALTCALAKKGKT